MKAKMPALALFLTLALILSACSGAAPTPPAEEPAPAAEPEPVTEPVTEPEPEPLPASGPDLSEFANMPIPASSSELVPIGAPEYYLGDNCVVCPLGVKTVFHTDVSDLLGVEGSGNAEHQALCNVSVSQNGDGTKTCKAEVRFRPFVIEYGDGSNFAYRCCAGFYDLYTGKMIVAGDSTVETEVKYGDKVYSVSLETADYGGAAAVFDPETKETKVFWGNYTLLLTCPADYDGAAFFIAGGGPEIDSAAEGFVTEVSDFQNGGFEICIFPAEE